VQTGERGRRCGWNGSQGVAELGVPDDAQRHDPQPDDGDAPHLGSMFSLHTALLE
jgi:hypothetical protein